MKRQPDNQDKRLSFHWDLRSRSRGAWITLLVLLGLSPSCAEELTQVNYVKPVKTAVFGGSGVSETRSFPGTVQAAQQARLSFRVAGPLIELPPLRGTGGQTGKCSGPDRSEGLSNKPSQPGGPGSGS